MNIKCYEKIDIEKKQEIVSAKLIYEKGEVEQIIPYLYQPIALGYDEEGTEYVKKDGDLLHKISFSVAKEGKYKLIITYADDNEEIDIEADGFFNKGYIEVSKKDKRYFAYSNGDTFYPVGINMAFPESFPVSNGKEFGRTDDVSFLGLRQYERWIKKCCENGVNLIRIWFGCRYFTPDTDDAEIFREEQFTKLDELIKIAKKYNVKVKLTIEHFRYFVKQGDGFELFHKNLKLKGEKCESARVWLTETKWKDAWLKKVEKIAARYSYDTEIFAVELWNEMNAVGEMGEDTYSDIIKWNKEMLPKVKGMFKNTLVVNSLGSLDCDHNLEVYKTFPWKDCDFVQMHRYLDQGGIHDNTKNHPIETLIEGTKMIKPEEKPFVVAETGAVNNCHSGPFKYYLCDDRGIIFVDCVYTPVFLESATCGNIWHWDGRYVEAKNLYKYYKPLAQLTQNIDFQNEEFESLDFSDDDVYLLILKGKTCSIGFIRNKNDSWKNVLRDGNEPVAVKVKVIEFKNKNVKKIDIWEDDTTKIESDLNNLKFSDILYGSVFYIEN